MVLEHNPFEDEFGSLPGPGLKEGGDVLFVSPPKQWTDENLNFLVYYLTRALTKRFGLKVTAGDDLADPKAVDRAIISCAFVIIVFDRPTEEIVYIYKTAELHQKPVFMVKAFWNATPEELAVAEDVPLDSRKMVITHNKAGDEERTLVKMMREMILERDSLLMGMFISKGEFKLDFLNALLKNLDVYTRRTLLKEMADKYPNDRSFWLASGRSKMLDGDVDEALRDFDEATQITPDDPWVFTQKGTSLVDIGDFDKALNEVAVSIHINPLNPHAHFVRGNAQYLLDNWEEALDSFETAYNQKKDYTAALNNLAHIFMLRGKHEDALKLLTRTIDIDREYPFSFLNRANCLKAMGKPYDRILAELKKAEKAAKDNIKKGDDFERSSYCLFYVYASAGNLDKAAEYLQKCVDYRIPVKRWRTLERVEDTNISENPVLQEIVARSQF